MIDPVSAQETAPEGAHTGKQMEKAKLQEACRQFESIFLAKLLKEARAEGAFWEEGEKAPFGALEETAMEMTAEALSEQGGIGLWEVLYESLEDNAK
jgi:Rod binding domain-containing protein